jgi:hypothetical protein
MLIRAEQHSPTRSATSYLEASTKKSRKIEQIFAQRMEEKRLVRCKSSVQIGETAMFSSD